jgi:glycosyltransferase involved in cell wall biosynthesis
MKVSVVLCTFNGEAFLEEQLQSIAQQTRVPDEVILCDDQSTDSTIEIAETVGASAGLNCVLSINTTRLGVEQNFSSAMMQASGDVLFFCDQDDVWLPEKVAIMLKPFEEDESTSLVYSDGHIVGPDLKPVGYTLFNRNPKKRLVEGDARDVGVRLKRGQSPGIKASSMAFASWVRDLAGPLPEGVAHDSWIAFFGYALGSVIAIDKPLHLYRRHDRTSGKSSTNTLIPGLKTVEKTDQSVMLQEKAHLAQCLYERMCWLEAETGKEKPFAQRFQDLKSAAKHAARTLKARANIVETPEILERLPKGVVALLNGDYIAVEGYRQKLSMFCRDTGLSKLKSQVFIR